MVQFQQQNGTGKFRHQPCKCNHNPATDIYSRSAVNEGGEIVNFDGNQDDYDHFLGLGKRARQRKADKHQLRMDKRRAKIDRIGARAYAIRTKADAAGTLAEQGIVQTTLGSQIASTAQGLLGAGRGGGDSTNANTLGDTSQLIGNNANTGYNPNSGGNANIKNTYDGGDAPAPKKDNSMMFIIGGVVLAVIVIVVLMVSMKKK